MKLKENFVTQTIGNEQMMIPVGEAANLFHGIVKSNGTAAFMVNQLKESTSEKEIVEAVLNEYDVAKEVATRDVRNILNKLRSIGALEE